MFMFCVQAIFGIYQYDVTMLLVIANIYREFFEELVLEIAPLKTYRVMISQKFGVTQTTQNIKQYYVRVVGSLSNKCCIFLAMKSW